MDQLKQHAVAMAIMAAITIALLELVTSTFFDLIFSFIMVGLMVVVAKFAAKK